MVRVKNNSNEKILLPVIITLEGKEVVNFQECLPQFEVKCSDVTDEMRALIEHGKLVVLEGEIPEALLSCPICNNKFTKEQFFSHTEEECDKAKIQETSSLPTATADKVVDTTETITTTTTEIE